MKIYENNIEYNLDENKEIASGGEGKIIQLDSNYIVKIYHDNIKPIDDKKFKYLNNLNPNLFAKPLSLIKDKFNKKIIGFKMQLIKGYDPIYSSYDINYCQRINLNNDKKLIIIDKLINSVKECHDNKIIIGDFNPFNILVDNNNQNIKLIDVDSYEIPGCKHSGILLDDIRDYYINDISEKSDYFALAVISFNLLTHVHPFKGVHKKYALNERMIYKIPVFSNDADLKTPKCYKPIMNDNLMNQFIKIFKNGERFLISLTDNKIIIGPTINVKIKDNNYLMINNFFSDPIIDIKCGNKLLLIESDKYVNIYDVSYKNNIHLIKNENKTSNRKYFIHDKNVFYLENNNFYKWDYLNNVNIKYDLILIDEEIIRIDQYDNILNIITENKSIQIFLDKLTTLNNKNYITNNITSIYGYGINRYSKNIIQNIGSSTFIYYYYNNTINKIKFSKNLKDVIQYKNIGIANYMENNKIKYCIFKIDNSNIVYNDLNIHELQNLTLLPDNTIVQVEDDYLIFRRIQDLNEIMKIECEYCTNQSQIFHSNSGIILRNENKVYLLNKKN
jgi:hypothetical protein